VAVLALRNQVPADPCCLGRDGIEHTVLCASRKLLPWEQNYFVAERGALFIIWAVGQFDGCLCGESDRRPLEYTQSSHPKNPTLMRWSCPGIVAISGF